jgi:long-chain acyl-CoA synthetase
MESSTAAAPAERFTGSRTIADMMSAAAERYRDRVMVRYKADGEWRDLSYREVGEIVSEIGRGLLYLGIKPGDRVALLCRTRPEWTFADFAITSTGAIVVPIYPTNSPEECAWVAGNSEARAIVCEDADQVAKILAVRDQLPALETIVVIDPIASGAPGCDEAIPLDEIRHHGRDRDPAELRDRAEAVAPDQPFTFIYTSGTTGPPKGCVVTHASLLATTSMYVRELGLRDSQMVIYLFLPLAHSLARVAQYATLEAGGTLAFWGGDPKRIVDELAEIRPTHFPSVPRIYEKVHATILGQIAEQGRLKQAVFRWALREGARAREAARAGTPPGRFAAARHRTADRLVLSKVRSVFGDRLAMAMCGAAPIGREVLEFFDACGVLVLEGYGMTETCAAATLNTPGAVRFGSVGRPLAGTEVAIAEDGEILMAGPNVFQGYHRDPDATGAVLHGRWLRSGDLGELDAEGYLHITGRKKDLIITSSGKNISPENLESALRETRWISQAVVAGDRRSYLVALLTLDPDEAPKLAAELGIPADLASMASDPRVHAAVQRDVDAVNARFARIEQVKRFAILERDLTQAEGELTPTLKVKRPVVHRRYGERIDRLYGEA